MINLDEFGYGLKTEDDKEIKDDEQYQHQLFEEYVLRINDNNCEKRKELKHRYDEGGVLTGPDGLRKQLAAFDLSYFGRAYLPHYFSRKSPYFHEELDKMWTDGVMKGLNPLESSKVIARMDGSHQAIAAPRGHAKSTNFTFKDSMHAVLYQYKHYEIILSDSSEQAEGFLDDIKTELEDNPRIIEDFGQLKSDKAWNSKIILTRTDVKVEANGSGKKIRGRRHRNWRPDLIVLDDIENDENVNTPEQRRKLKSWFDKAVSKAGDTYTDIMYIGTILHYDSLLSRVLVNPTYKTQKYRAVISFAKNTKLWEEWESIYVNLFDENHKMNALTFYQANEKEMLEGAEVLWEEKNPYYKLMETRLSEGEASFNSELQNDPIDPENADFNEEWLDYYEPELMDFSKPNYLLVGANDPSLGKNKKSDTSSIIDLALDLNSGYMYIVGASVERRKPDAIIDDVIETHRRYKRDLHKGYYRFGVETVQFQYFFKDVMAAKALEAGEYIPIEEIQSIANKELRIRSLQPFVKNKWIKFSREHKELIKQLTEFPMGAHDDAPDGLQMAVSLAQSVRATASRPEYKTVQRRRSNFRKGAW